MGEQIVDQPHLIDERSRPGCRSQARSVAIRDGDGAAGHGVTMITSTSMTNSVSVFATSTLSRRARARSRLAVGARELLAPVDAHDHLRRDQSVDDIGGSGLEARALLATARTSRASRARRSDWHARQIFGEGLAGPVGRSRTGLVSGSFSSSIPERVEQPLVGVQPADRPSPARRPASPRRDRIGEQHELRTSTTSRSSERARRGGETSRAASRADVTRSELEARAARTASSGCVSIELRTSETTSSARPS